jgi:hypothetical protein
VFAQSGSLGTALLDVWLIQMKGSTENRVVVVVTISTYFFISRAVDSETLYKTRTTKYELAITFSKDVCLITIII